MSIITHNFAKFTKNQVTLQMEMVGIFHSNQNGHIMIMMLILWGFSGLHLAFPASGDTQSDYIDT